MAASAALSRLPNTISTDDIEASYENGVLKIRLAKRAEAKPKQIKVNIGQKTIEGKKEPQAAAKTTAA